MIQETNDEIQHRVDEDERARAERDQARLTVLAIDDLLFQLEELNLQDEKRVPPDLQEHAAKLLRLVPVPDDPEFRVRPEIVPMMDVLFWAQEILLRIRNSRKPGMDPGD